MGGMGCKLWMVWGVSYGWCMVYIYIYFFFPDFLFSKNRILPSKFNEVV